MGEIVRLQNELDVLRKEYGNGEDVGERIELIQEILHSLGVRDKCSKCKGERGGLPGNENIVDSVILCDYCHAEVMV